MPGIDHPEPGTDKTATTVGMRRYEDVYRANKKRPDPFLEFCLAWLRRNPLDPKGRESVVVWDSGQLHHEDGHLVAVLDVELAHVGDPMMDLAGFRQRDSILHYGDMDRLYTEYEACGGVPVDMDAIQHHNFAFTLSNQLAFHSALAAPAPESDYMTNLQWCCETNLFAVEALAEIARPRAARQSRSPRPRMSLGAVADEHLVGAAPHRSRRPTSTSSTGCAPRSASPATSNGSTRSATRAWPPTSTTCTHCSATDPRRGRRVTPRSRRSSSPTTAPTTRRSCSSSTGACGGPTRCWAPPARP